MPKLIVNPTSSARREIKLARTLLSIGRDPSNDLVLPDAMVSRRHAVIECRGNQYYLRDCNSSNGSVVNGDRISERSLRDGDLVAIGTARLLFREEIELDDPGAKVVQHPSAPRLHCPKCRADYRKGDLFCRECGSALLAPVGPRKAVCASCGTAVLLPAKFCNACGARLPLEEAEAPVASEPPPVLASEAPATDSPLATDDGARSSEPVPPPDTSGPPVAAAAESVLPSPAPMRVEPRHGRSMPLEEMPIRRTEAPPLSEPRKVVARGAAAAAPSPRPASRPWRPAAAGSRPGAATVPAPLGPRLFAALIDGLLLALLQAVVVGPLAFLWSSREGVVEPAEGGGVLAFVVPLGLVALALVLGLAYHVVFWATRGATPGKIFLGLAVVADDGAPIAWPAALARGVGYALSGAALGVGFLMIAFGGIGLHDRIAGTRVVQRRPRE
jgi:uncharacterized RDD family membrane protein YckC